MSDYRITGRKSEWISVNDRLPALHKEVLVYTPDSPDADRQVAYRTASRKWCDAREFSPLEEQPTHWMPLPEPPEGER